MVAAYQDGVTMRQIAAAHGVAPNTVWHHLSRLLSDTARPRQHGSVQGLRRHKAEGEDPCEMCVSGAAVARRRYASARRNRSAA